MSKQFVVVVCGPTASGKTALGVELARALDGEIISADSMQIYKGMDIASAKPSKEEMHGVPHHLMGFLEPFENFSVAQYVTLAHEVISDIASRGKLPIVVGGTGLYINSLIDDISFEHSECDYEYRQELRRTAAEKGNAYLLSMLREVDKQTAHTLHENNLSRIIRALEVYKTTGRTMTELRTLSRAKPSRYNPCMIMPDYDRAVLYERINRRVDIMLASGLIDEAREFLSRGYTSTASQAIGYKELSPYFDGSAPLDECVENLKAETRRYAKRQFTWFNRDDRIHKISVGEGNNFYQLVLTAKNYIKGMEI